MSRNAARLMFAVCFLIGQFGLASDPIRVGLAHAQSNEVKELAFPDPAPKPPTEANQFEYFSLPNSRTRYWLDLASLAVGENETVRFSTLLVSESGVRNVRHEAFRCASSERRLLAIGRSDGSWSVTPDAPWQPIRLGNNTNLGYPELFRALCFGGANADAQKVSEKLRSGLKVGNY